LYSWLPVRREQGQVLLDLLGRAGGRKAAVPVVSLGVGRESLLSRFETLFNFGGERSLARLFQKDQVIAADVFQRFRIPRFKLRQTYVISGQLECCLSLFIMLLCFLRVAQRMQRQGNVMMGVGKFGFIRTKTAYRDIQLTLVRVRARSNFRSPKYA